MSSLPNPGEPIDSRKGASAQNPNATKPHSVASLLKLLPDAFLPGLIGAISALGVAYVSGVLNIRKEDAVREGQLKLEQQKFSYELIRKALNDTKDAEKANALLFLADTGLLSNLNVAKIKEYANREEKRMRDEPESSTLLPRLSPASSDYPRYNLPMPAPEAGGTTAGLQLLRIALDELNRGVHEDRDRQRVQEYFAAVGMNSGIDAKAMPWSAAFLSWALKQAGNPGKFPMSVANSSLWRHALESRMTFLPGEQVPQPGDIAFFLQGSTAASLLAEVRQRATSHPMHAAIVYSIEGDFINAIGGNVSDALRFRRYALREASGLVGFARIKDSDAK